MGDLIRLPTAPTPPDDVLDQAKGLLDTVFVLGKDHKGRIFMACSTADCGEAMLLLARAEHSLMEMIAQEHP